MRLSLILLVAACVPSGKDGIYTSKIAGGIGAACTQDADCRDARCFTGNNWVGFNTDTFGGFCTRTCASDAECGAGPCLHSADGNDYCMPPCNAPGDCRESYICVTPKNHCEPISLYTLDCDPEAVTCTTQSGSGGGCLRVALGNGQFGHCRQECFFASGCASGDACHYWDDHPDGGKYQGMVCFTAAQSPTAFGAPCSNTNDCASGSNCVTVDGVNAFCGELCLPATGCQSGASCVNFNPAGPVGVCTF